MRIKRTFTLIIFILVATVSFAMRYQIKVLNTPTITINGQELKVGDWFDDKSVINWSTENQAMRVLSEDNRVYTLSAKLYKEIKATQFSDFILYTKPLASRGVKTLRKDLKEKFDNYFIMLDEVVIDLSNINLPDNISIYFIAKNHKDKKGNFILSKSTAKFSRKVLEQLGLNEDKILRVDIFMQLGQSAPMLIINNIDIEIVPLELDVCR